MHKLDGTLVIKFEGVALAEGRSVSQIIEWIAKIIEPNIASGGKELEDTSVTGKVIDVDQSGIKGSVTVTHTDGNLSLSGTVKGKTDGTIDGGGFTATLNFD